MDTNKPALKIILAMFFIVTGSTHFINTRFFLGILPDYVPQSFHLLIVYLSGVLEVSLGLLLLIPATTRVAAWWLIGVLIAVTPSYLHLCLHPEVLPDVSPLLQFFRLAIQALLVAWCYWYTRPEPARPAFAAPLATRLPSP